MSKTISALSETVKTTFGETTANTLALKPGTLLDPNMLKTLANQSTAMSSDGLQVIEATVSASGLSVPLAQASSLIECAQNLEDRIIAKVIEKAMEYVLSNSAAKEVISTVQIALAYANAVNSVIETLKQIKPLSLLQQLIAAKALQGIQRSEAIAKIIDTFGDVVDNIYDLVADLDVLDICNLPDYDANGAVKGSPLLSPSSAPMSSPLKASIGTIDENLNEVKYNYDEVMVDIREYTTKENGATDEGGYSSMITSVNTVAMAYHNKILNSKDDVQDAEYYTSYVTSIDVEYKTHSGGWSETVRQEYSRRTSGIGQIIKSQAAVIRAYGMRNSNMVATGALISKGVTWYSSPYGDYTTFLDIKPAQRPPELIAYWEARGEKNITGNYYTNSRGKTIKIGTLDYDNAFHGPFGDKLISDFSCSSTRVPIGSVLALKNPDGTPYNPSGKNPSGVYTVHDTGNIELTYNKVDIYTDTPAAYQKSNMAAVQVFLVSRGTKLAPQYKKAQARYGGGNAI